MPATFLKDEAARIVEAPLNAEARPIGGRAKNVELARCTLMTS
jgi:hypothetical protein